MAHPSHPDLAGAALHWFGQTVEHLSAAQRRVLSRTLARKPIAIDSHPALPPSGTLGERLADRVASFGGSWTFILLFTGVLLAWTGANLWLLSKPFDPYPFIFLNLMLSMLAAVQAPIIMMSQNRQTARDRNDAAHDYEVNLKAEIEIMALHEKIDGLRIEQMQALLDGQQRQIELMTRLLEEGRR